MISDVARRFQWVVSLTLITALGISPGLAQAAKMTLAPGFSPADGVTKGFTRASFSLLALSNRDRDDHPCLGFGNDRDTPDHVLVLKENFTNLKIQVQSRGNSPTLLIQNSSGETVFCGSSSVESQWGAGTYRVWVGCNEGSTCNYTFVAKE
ncbi:MAG: hypothetical protein KME16_14775 [Scytolyngbya sp. HA4215-MV1]|nr:hypothetical protein [Scytolyngbya sp. HA4215-MV1]